MNDAPIDKLQKWSEQGHRTVQADTLMMLAADYPEVVALSADLTPTARLVEFKETYPDRFFDVGIAEQNLIDFTAGLALEGLSGPGPAQSQEGLLPSAMCLAPVFRPWRAWRTSRGELRER